MFSFCFIYPLSSDFDTAKIPPQKREVKFSGQNFPSIFTREGDFSKYQNEN